MSISTPLTQRLGIAHPILLAPMDLVSDAKLTAAVSAAGGFGILGGGYGDADWLARELDALGRSGARFGVGFITWSMAKQPQLLDLVLERKPAAVDAFIRRPEAVCGPDQTVRCPRDLPGPVGRAREGSGRVRRGRSRRAGYGGRRPRRIARGRVAGAGSRRRGRREGAGRRRRRHRRRARARGGADARRLGRAPRHALLRHGGSGRSAGREGAHPRRHRRRHAAEHRVRHLPAQRLARPVHGAVPAQRSHGALVRTRGRAPAAPGRRVGAVRCGPERGQLRRRGGHRGRVLRARAGDHVRARGRRAHRARGVGAPGERQR